MTAERKTSFATAFGRTIEFVPGHIELVRRTVGLPEKAGRDWQNANINLAGGHENLDYDKINEMLGGEGIKALSLNGYAARLHRTYQLVTLLRNTSITYPFEKCLDIGCGNAIQPRIMKGLGMVREAVGIDVYDRASNIDESKLSRQHRQFRRRRLLASSQQRKYGTAPVPPTGLKGALGDVFPDLRNQYKLGTGWTPDVGVFQLRYVAKPKLDRYINGDVFELHEEFDLITSFSSLEWFEARAAFRKISGLLEPNGVFYLWVPNWWCAVNTTSLAGHFPYASQRLTREDYFRYLDDCMPDSAEAMKVAYSYFDPSHPTLSDYIDIGYENGLVMLDYKSNIIPELVNRKRGVTSLGYFQLDHTGMKEVLDDIHQFRPDVRLDDLLAHSHAIIFKKVDSTNRIENLDLEEFLPDDRQFPPASLPKRITRKIARDLLTPIFGR